MGENPQGVDPFVLVVTAGVSVGIAMGGVNALIALSRGVREAWTAGMRRLRAWAHDGGRMLDDDDGDETLRASVDFVCRQKMIGGVPHWAFVEERRDRLPSASGPELQNLPPPPPPPSTPSSSAHTSGSEGQNHPPPLPPPPSTPSGSADASGLEEPLPPPSSSP